MDRVEIERLPRGGPVTTTAALKAARDDEDPAKILVIDDNLRIAHLLAISLREVGYGVLGAPTGAEGLRLFTLSQPDVVLLDMALPGGLNGIEVLKRIRSINPTARVIMLTANTNIHRARTALELGAVAYVDKPFDLAYLKRVVAMALQADR